MDKGRRQTNLRQRHDIDACPPRNGRLGLLDILLLIAMADGDDKHIALALATSACVKVRTIEKTVRQVFV